MAITQLIYHSRYKPLPGQSRLDTLRAILAASQPNNSRDKLTGFLLFDRNWFFQILEGEADQVQAAYNRIQKDPRHESLTTMAMRQVPRRSFPEWSMGGALRGPEQQEIFLRHGISGELEPSKVAAVTILALAMDLQLFLDAYNYARRLKTLHGLTPYEHVFQVWTKEPERFRLDPSHNIPGPYT
jgi:hypothetical protein